MRTELRAGGEGRGTRATLHGEQASRRKVWLNNVLSALSPLSLHRRALYSHQLQKSWDM